MVPLNWRSLGIIATAGAFCALVAASLPGAAAEESPNQDLAFAHLGALGYTLYPVRSLQVLNASATVNPDKPLAEQIVGPGGFDVVLGGTFTYDTKGHYHYNPTGPVMRGGVQDTPGLDKARYRGGVAVLQNGKIVIGRQQGNRPEEIHAAFDAPGTLVKDFMGGGVLLIEQGQKVSDADLRQRQRFDQGQGGIKAEQLGMGFHTLIGAVGDQIFAICAAMKSGEQMQNELFAAGFTYLVKFDGGSGGYQRDTTGTHQNGRNSTGFGIMALPVSSMQAGPPVAPVALTNPAS